MRSLARRRTPATTASSSSSPHALFLPSFFNSGGGGWGNPNCVGARVRSGAGGLIGGYLGFGGPRCRGSGTDLLGYRAGARGGHPRALGLGFLGAGGALVRVRGSWPTGVQAATSAGRRDRRERRAVWQGRETEAVGGGEGKANRRAPPVSDPGAKADRRFRLESI